MKIIVNLILATLLPACVTKVAPQSVIDGHLDAYRQRDLDRFIEYFHPEIEVYDFPDKLLVKGRDKLKPMYTKMFKLDKEVKILSRVLNGSFVIDDEKIISEKFNAHMPVVYEIKDGLIFRMMFLRE